MLAIAKRVRLDIVRATSDQKLDSPMRRITLDLVPADLPRTGPRSVHILSTNRRHGRHRLSGGSCRTSKRSTVGR